MKIFVCIKQVPDTEAKLKPSADKLSVETAGVKWVMNPYDEFAVEEAVKIKEANPSAQSIVVTIGPKPRAQDALRTALAMGIDEAIHIDTTEPVDSFATAKMLAQLITKEGGADLILMGKGGIDLNMSATPQMLAAQLQRPCFSVVSKLTITDGHFELEKDMDGGNKQILTGKLPIVVSANKGLNMPRYASLPGIMKAKMKVIKEIPISELGFKSEDIKVTFKAFELPQEKPTVKMLEGDSSKQTAELVRLLREESKVI